MPKATPLSIVVPAEKSGFPSGQTIRGVWDSTGNAKYYVNDIVYWNGSIYKCAASNTAVYPTNTTYWIPLDSDSVIDYAGGLAEAKALATMTVSLTSAQLGDEPAGNFGEFGFGS